MSGIAELCERRPGDHVCWSVDDDDAYLNGARELLLAAAARGEKPMLFGPKDSRPLLELAGLAAVAADPLVDLLGGEFDANAMLEMFTKETAQAHHDGYRAVAVVADMDWLLPAATPEQVLAFEMLLDRKINELGATVACAYRHSSYHRAVRRSLHAVHPVSLASDEVPAFRLVAGEDGTWLLSGELDCADAEPFAAALAAATTSERCVINARHLDFIDVSGMRQLARASAAGTLQLRIANASPILRRAWEIAGFAKVAPSVQLDG